MTPKQKLRKALKRGLIPKRYREEVRELLAAPTLADEVAEMFSEEQKRNSGAKYKTPVRDSEGERR